MSSQLSNQRPSPTQAIPVPNPDRKPVSHRWVWIGLITLAIVVLGVFVVGYWVLVRYEDKVARHIPSTAIGALRLDIEQVVLYEPTRKHIFPVLDGAKSQARRLAQLKADTGINLGMDLREIMVAALPDGDFVLAVGGLFPEQGLVPRIVGILPADSGCSLAGVRLRCVMPHGRTLVLEQAADGVLVAATSETALGLALVEGGGAKALNLAAAPIALSLNTAQTGPWTSVGLGVGSPDWLNQLRGISAQSDLGDPLQVQVALQGVDSNAKGAVESWLSRVQTLVGLVPGPDVAGERALLARATVEALPTGPVSIRSQWDRKDVERAARWVADWLETALRP